MKTVLFFSNLQDICSEDAFVAYIPINITTKEDLFTEFNKQLRFPYFGFNWDALYDLFRDFHWIYQKSIVIVHQDIPLSDKNNQAIYIELLFDCINDWKDDEDHNLTVYFPIEFQEQINNCINEVTSKKTNEFFDGLLDSVD
jgi:hypothetical protein